jgi:hypothetical protein
MCVLVTVETVLLVLGQEIEELGAGDVVDQRVDALLGQQRQRLLDEGIGHGALLKNDHDIRLALWLT